MASLEADESFRIYQSTGDPRALARVFDLLAPELLLVAAHVARSQAEDLVQATFLSAIECASRFDPRRPVLPWLIGILVKQALRERRRQRRRTDPLRLTASAATDPLEAAEEAEFADRFAKVLGNLPPIYRSALTLRLVHGLREVQIAHSLGCRPNTVKTRIRRGLEILRQRLPAGLALPGLLLVAAGPALAAARAVVLARATELAGANGPSLGGGVTASQMKLGAAALGICIAACLAWASLEGPEPETPLRAHAMPEPESRSSERVAEDGIQQPDGSRPRPGGRVAIPEAPARGSLRIRVVWDEDGVGAAGVFVNLLPRFVANPTLHERWLETGGDGTVLVSDLAPGALQLTGDRGGEVDAEVSAGAETDVTLRIPAGLAVVGRVVDPDGAPVRNARVWLSKKQTLDEGCEVTVTNEAGTFELRSVEPLRCVSALAEGWQPTPLTTVDGVPGSRVELRLSLDAPGAPLSGIVVDSQGRPVAGASVLVGSKFFRPASPYPVASQKRRPPPLAVRTDARGVFHVGNRETQGACIWVRAEGFAPWTGWAGGPGTSGRMEICLTQGVTLTGTVTGAHQVPAGGARVEVTDEATEPLGLPYLGPPWCRSVCWAAEDGSFRLDGIRPGILHVRASGADGVRATAELIAKEGKALRWDPRLAPARPITGTVQGKRGEPLEGWYVKAYGPLGRGELPRVRTDALGSFHIPDCEECPYTLLVHQAESAWSGPAVTVLGVRPGDAPVRATVPDASLPTSHIEGVVLGSSRAANVCVTSSARSGSTWANCDATSGRFRTGPIPAGVYHLAIYHDGQLARMVGPVHLARGAVLDCGETRIEEPGSLRVSVRTEALGPGPRGTATVSGVDGFHWISFPITGEVDQSPPLQPGRYLLQLSGEHMTRLARTIEVVSGEELALDFTVPAGSARRFTVEHPEDGSDLVLDWAWLDAQGRMIFRDQTTWFRTVRSAREVTHRFVPGAYRLRVTSQAGLRAEVSFVVHGLAPVTTPVHLKLR